MIPKIIHYCWISGEENMPEDIKKCIESWHKYLPDYQFINWNDTNFDWNTCEFTRHCRDNNLYAFCADYIRFWALYNYGGIYLDSDVQVFKSFDELLKMKRIITRERLYQKYDNLEAAIMGCEKGDIVFKHVIDWYNNCGTKWTDKKYVVAPEVIKRCWVNKYKFRNIDDPKFEKVEDSLINIIDCNKYFNSNSEFAIAQHQFKGSWTESSIKEENCLRKDDLKIFLCAHKPIENYIPVDDRYIILDVSGTVKDDKHTVIDISQDEFTKNHNVAYSEGCAMRYLWKHPEMLPDYICFGHYRRMFTKFVGQEEFIPRYVDKHGAIVKIPFRHRVNRESMFNDHPYDETNAFIKSVEEAAPEYWISFCEMLRDNLQYACNCFAMKKEDFLEMCEMCFRVLDHFDRKQGYKNNEDVFRKMVRTAHTEHLKYGINWQKRLQGFWLEWLTDLYCRHKFKGSTFKAEAKIPEPLVIKSCYDS